MDQIHPIVQRRHTALVLIRSVALVALLVGLFSVLYPLGRALQLGFDRQTLFAIWDWPAWFGLALGTLVPGLGLLIFNDRLARWLVPVPRPVCPECGYDLRTRGKGKCPECGLDLAAMDQPS